MKIPFEVIDDTADYIISNYMSIKKEISGFIKENLDLKISIGSKTYTKWFDDRITFHTHVGKVYRPSIQDFNCLLNSINTKIHVLITKKSIIIFNKLNKTRGYHFFAPSVSKWNKTWRDYFKLTGWEIYEKSI